MDEGEKIIKELAMIIGGWDFSFIDALRHSGVLIKGWCKQCMYLSSSRAADLV